jgi:hypothetical protein
LKIGGLKQKEKTMIPFLKSERAKLFEGDAEVASRHKAEVEKHTAIIETIDNDAGVRERLRVDALLKQRLGAVESLRDTRERHRAEINLREARKSELAHPMINEAIEGLYRRRQEDAQRIEVSGRKSRNFLGVETAFLLSNKKKVDQEIGKIDEAIRRLRALLIADVADPVAEVEKIMHTLSPVPDLSVEETEISPLQAVPGTV